MEAARPHAISHKLLRIVSKLQDKLYRDAFVGARARRFLAHQMRALRGKMSQADFGKLVDKPQSVVSRLEDPSYGKMTLNSLLDIAAKLDRALVVQFIDWKAFLKMTEDDSEEASAPAAYDQAEIELFAQQEAAMEIWQPQLLAGIGQAIIPFFQGSFAVPSPSPNSQWINSNALWTNYGVTQGGAVLAEPQKPEPIIFEQEPENFIQQESISAIRKALPPDIDQRALGLIQ
jgi:hypothetical protein